MTTTRSKKQPTHLEQNPVQTQQKPVTPETYSCDCCGRKTKKAGYCGRCLDF